MHFARLLAALIALAALPARAVDSEPVVKTKVCNPAETLCADVITTAGQNRLTVDSSPANDTASTANSTTSTLGSGATFTGTFEDLLPYADVSIGIKANVGGTLTIQWSPDGTNIDDTDVYTIIAGSGKQYSFGTMYRYVRISYTNGASSQSSFRLQTIFHRVRGKPSSHRIDDAIVANDDAELVKSVITGKSPDGSYRNVRVDNDGNFVTTAITGFGADFSFGDVTLASTSIAVVRRTAYAEQTTNAQRSFSSTDVDDDGSPAGTGARTIRVEYLDSTGAGPYTETLVMNGTTCVSTVATNIAYVEGIKVLTVGSTGSNEGTISMFVNSSCGGGTIGPISVNNNQTYWAHHYVPIGKIANITGISTSHNGTTVGSGGVFVLKAKSLSATDAVDDQVSDFVRLYGQSSTFARTYASPIKITGPSRLLLYVTPETSTSTVYRAAIDFFEQ